MTVPVQKPGRNFRKQEFILTRIICQLYTAKPVKTTQLDQAYHKHSPNKQSTVLGGFSC